MVEKELDSLDRQLLDLVQSDFPLVVEPFAKLAADLSLSPEELLDRLRRMREMGLIRRISAIFDSRRLGYRSTLAAFSVDDDRLDEVAILINAHPGVSHNYARTHLFNLWFTLTLPPGQDVEAAVAKLAKDAGVERYLVLPALRVFKIGVRFKMAGEKEVTPTAEVEALTDREEASLAPSDIPLVRELQKDLNLVPRPFAHIASRLGMSEQELLARMEALKEAGIMRRYAAVLHHRRVGFGANAMGCWIIPPARVEEVGRLAASFSAVSHCYERRAYPPRWPYNLFTMIHGQRREECEEVAREISFQTGIEDYILLYSTKEYKKERVNYFVEGERDED
ncbi:MAG: AsnC family transcriptional regulator [Anaerolineae bacterium]